MVTMVIHYSLSDNLKANYIYKKNIFKIENNWPNLVGKIYYYNERRKYMQ